METLVLAFDTQYYKIDELQALTPAERYELAATDKATGGDTCEISTLKEFQALFNSGCVSHDFSYIFFHEVRTEPNAEHLTPEEEKERKEAAEVAARFFADCVPAVVLKTNAAFKVTFEEWENFCNSYRIPYPQRCFEVVAATYSNGKASFYLGNIVKVLRNLGKYRKGHYVI